MLLAALDSTIVATGVPSSVISVSFGLSVDICLTKWSAWQSPLV